MGKFVDLKGLRFGRLTVVRMERNNGRIKWICECDCGGATVTDTSRLKSGQTQSCGCLQRERTSKACKKDLSGEKFGELLVLKRISKTGEPALYLCKCDCGKTTVVRGCNLKSGATKSCGCLRRKATAGLRYSHGKHNTKIYKCWCNMRDRCSNQNNKEYSAYGGRGIHVCDEWSKFSTFYNWAMLNGYDEDLTIERIDVNKNYCPENCTWVNRHDQSRNRTDNRKITFNGKTMILKDWGDEIGINEATIRNRLNSGWTVEKALTTPVRRFDPKK